MHEQTHLAELGTIHQLTEKTGWLRYDRFYQISMQMKVGCRGLESLNKSSESS